MRMRRSEIIHFLTYVDWRKDAELVKGSTEEFGKLLEERW